MAVNARVHNVARGNRRSYSEQLFTEWLSRCLQNARLSRARGAEWADRVSRQRDRARVREHARVLTAAVDSGLCSADWLCLRSSAHGSVHWKRALGSAAAAAAEHAAVPHVQLQTELQSTRSRAKTRSKTDSRNTHTPRAGVFARCCCWCVFCVLVCVRACVRERDYTFTHITHFIIVINEQHIVDVHIPSPLANTRVQVR